MSNAGIILRVDLTNRTIEKDSTSSYLHDYVGGLSIGTKILWDGVPPEVTAHDPKNMVIFSAGPLTGTLLGNRCVLIAKSPIYPNQTIGNAGLGGQFPSEMKFAGYDHIVITGKAEEPVYLFINNDIVEIKDAKHLWGSDVYQTQTAIKHELKDPDVQIACIGPAGENLVAYSMVLHDIENTASRVGHGAVMGSKNLKAVAVRGTKGLKIADPEAFMALWKQFYEYYTTGRGRYVLKTMNREGVAIHYDHYLDKDTMVWGNFDSFVVPPRKKEEEISDFMNEYLVGRIGCAFCPAQCHENYYVDGIGGGGATCMFYTGFRFVVKNKDLRVWWRLNQLCQRYGMETLSASGITAWLMDLYEQGIITAADTDGVPMEWGSEEACKTVIEKIAKREGFGDLLADGIVSAAQRLGRDSISYAVQYRNLNVHPGYGPVGATGGTNALPGASEVWIHPPVDIHAHYPWIAPELGVSTEEAEKIVYDWLSEFTEKTTGDKNSWREDNYEKYADFAIVNETAISVCDISGHCDWLSDRLPQVGCWWGPEDVARAITAATGTECTTELLVNAHKRRRLLELTYMQLCYRAFGEQDEIPMKLLRPRPDGYFKGAIADFERVLQVMNRYYELMGIDPVTCLPLREELEKLGLVDVADMLETLPLQSAVNPSEKVPESIEQEK
ncbi:aldehyde ferredoxin oxidoreductase N-terminal domain-containing protein [Chloroflexota bacterium]